MYKAALFLNILLLFRRQARFASIGAQKKMFQADRSFFVLQNNFLKTGQKAFLKL